jgi:superfamily II DNA or RNA helicase
MSELPVGLYERLLDEELQDLLDACPELRPILRSIEDEAAPRTYAQFVSQLLGQALRIVSAEDRLPILNRIIELLSATDGLEYLQRKRLLAEKNNLLISVGSIDTHLARPATPLAISSLLTGQGDDPPLEHELRHEMATSDRVDMLVSFVKWSGLRLLIPALERLTDRLVPVRIISTSYMGASDPEALEWLARQPNIRVRISYDTAGTRLHAKAYHFVRNTGYSTAYVGSANMSHSAMTQGLEWTVKVTAQDMPHILQRFEAEFTAYWESDEFEDYCEQDFERFRRAINDHRQQDATTRRFFADITARPFQARILEALAAARQQGKTRNLVVAATGTGKTVISALDYKRYIEEHGRREPLLFVAHRKEILEQARECFQAVLRDPDFGELFVDGQEPLEWRHVFASIQSLARRRPWSSLGASHFRFVVVDEAHHISANSYREVAENLEPEILLGLTATPERMDGTSILPDFGDEFSAEIRLPEALEEKLLCPFHFFGITDTVDLSDERFWKNGRYDAKELENVLAIEGLTAHRRVDNILEALRRYQPNLDGVRGVGFCAGVRHAKFMAECFNEAGIRSSVVTGDVPSELRASRLQQFRDGDVTFLFVVDVLSEGVDIPEINLVMFLRPTESLTVFLQQLGRGLRHAPGKDCLTVLDFVGQTHRHYRLDTKFAALLSRRRQRIDREIEADFPNLPPGCSIQLERIAREHILQKIRSVLDDLKHFVPESIRTWDTEVGGPLTFSRFINETKISPVEVLARRSWSEWKAMAWNKSTPNDPDLDAGRKALSRLALRTDPGLLEMISDLSVHEEPAAYEPSRLTALHYVLWGKKGGEVGVETLADSIAKWRRNPSVIADAAEIAAHQQSHREVVLRDIPLPFPCWLKLHAAYGSHEIKAALGLATLESPGSTGVGVIHAKELKAYIHLVTFRKEESDFSPTTRYRDYPISRTLLHWESQSNTTRASSTGQNYIHFKDRGYTILFFARVDRRIDDETAPFHFLGPAKNLVSYDGDRPISMVWELEYPMPAAMFEQVRPA